MGKETKQKTIKSSLNSKRSWHSKNKQFQQVQTDKIIKAIYFFSYGK